MVTYLDVYREFLVIPYGVEIDNPKGKIYVGTITHTSQNIIKSKSVEVAFTRMSLKHIAEKPSNFPGYLLDSIPEILTDPDEIRHSKSLSSGAVRYFFIKKLANYTRPLTVIVEVSVHKDANTIVTTFPVSAKYISDFSLLWKTEAN